MHFFSSLFLIVTLKSKSVIIILKFKKKKPPSNSNCLVKRPREDNAQRITLHRKCGFAVQVLVAATSVSEGEMRLRLAGVETHDDAQVAKVEMEATSCRTRHTTYARHRLH